MATNDQRTHALAICQFLLNRPSQVHYLKQRPMTTNGLYEQDLVTLLGRGGSISIDCSEAVTMICRMAGFKDPNGFGYNGNGNTITLYDHLTHYVSPPYDASRANVGALVTFGVPDQPQDNQHVAMVIEKSSNPLLFSHGSTKGPIKILLSDYMTAVPSQTPVAFLNVASL